MVRIHPDPPSNRVAPGAIAQLGERLLCKQEVTGSIPVGSTRKAGREAGVGRPEEKQTEESAINVAAMRG